MIEQFGKVSLSSLIITLGPIDNGDGGGDGDSDDNYYTRSSGGDGDVDNDDGDENDKNDDGIPTLLYHQQKFYSN